MPIKAFVYISPSKRMLIRVGYAVSKGIRKATLRNRIKRLMRESFRINNQDLVKRLCGITAIEIVFLYNSTKEITRNRPKFESINRSIANLCSTVAVVFPE
ncbi:MAG: ribonuclease P protein component [Candidatus Helarchaeota archaeon]|nr:ribonuclease P protein component [Candidatus Helarchaeota archaeon]